MSFASNVFHSYTSYYAEDYLLSLDTMGAPLRCELDSNVFVDGANDVSHYLLLSGPMDVVMTNQSVDDDSSWLYAQDVHSMHIADHLFGPNFLSSAIVISVLSCGWLFDFNMLCSVHVVVRVYCVSLCGWLCEFNLYVQYTSFPNSRLWFIWCFRVNKPVWHVKREFPSYVRTK